MIVLVVFFLSFFGFSHGLITMKTVNGPSPLSNMCGFAATICDFIKTYYLWSRDQIMSHSTRIPIELLFRQLCIYLFKPARGDSHFCGHVSPMFCNMSPFFFYLPLSLTVLTAFILPTLMLILFSVCSTTDLFFYTSFSSFRLNLMSFSRFRFIQKFSMFVHFSMMFNLTQLTSEPHACHHDPRQIRIKKLSSHDMFAD